MGAARTTTGTSLARPILLYNDECGVCRRIANWVRNAAQGPGKDSPVDVRPIGEDPNALRALNPALNIWDAYDTVHLLMPDGSMLLGGQAVAEVLRRLPATRWFAWCFAISLFGWQPFQQVLDLAYTILADVRPIFGCESCGTPSAWVLPFVWVSTKTKAMFGSDKRATKKVPPFTTR
ncbi:thiol-disulfide oxidoreductase DCC family protein [Rhodoferax sp. U11-2br]|uniref:thiol-disulfide oxidoreductase DCC family protein n=1 Tax=Rhodoferax sp. U11-2br TaxID=2838878 RepID=UPI001BEC87B5|nr:DCC1-like thiol-disulfide oxidoreductase family protein [Rhodoferax sp. U11-2br]MBT3068306.1 DUF393 domain-containing protein [Rhodoferax sp. U11-2br]